MPGSTTAKDLTTLRSLIDTHQWDALRSELAEHHFSDIAELIIDLPPEQEGIVFRVLPRDQAGPVFSYLPFEHQQQLLRSISNEQMLGLVESMAPDDRTRLLEELPAEVTRNLLESLPHNAMVRARALLGYPEDSAGRFMTPEYVALNPRMTAAEALQHIRQTGRARKH
jgi:magnesium transporter